MTVVEFGTFVLLFPKL